MAFVRMDLLLGVIVARGQPKFIGRLGMYGGGHDSPIGQHLGQFVGIVAFWATALGFVGVP